MKLVQIIVCSLIVAAAVSVTAAWSSQSPSFETLLAEGGLVFAQSDALEEISASKTELYEFEKGFRHKTLPLEVHYAIRPLQRLKIDYSDPHNSAPEPNHMYAMVFHTLVGRLAAHGAISSRDYQPGKAKLLFNADWAAAGLFNIDQRLHVRYRTALLLAIHKNHKADAYAIFMFDDPKPLKTTIDKLLAVLKFHLEE